MSSIAESRSKRSNVKKINYNETQLWNRKLKEYSSSDSDDEIAPRRSPKEKPSKNYKEESTTSYSDEETSEEEYDSDEQNENEEEEYEEDEYDEEEDEMIVQAILGIREDFKVDLGKESETTEDEGETQYYVKFQDKAYIHCQWLKESEIKNLEGGESALTRFNRRQKSVSLSPSVSIENLLTFEDNNINNDWFKVDRIIDERGEDEDEGGKEYYVKWQSLEYNESTWEYEKDIEDKRQIELYEARINHSNPIRIPSRWKRPPPEDFKLIETPVESKQGFELRDYQMEGLNWMRRCWYQRRNNILADEMGLGKTAQVVSMLSDLAVHENVEGPFLVVVPLSTLPHWKSEFENWSDLNAVVYHGNAESREIIKRSEFNVISTKGKLIPDRVQFDVLVTNYETLLQDFRVFSGIEWRYVIFDEAHRLKNPRSKVYAKVEELVFEHCTLLTGTPVQNNIDELWALLHIIHPDRFDDPDDFNEKYGEMKSSEQAKEIQEIIKPILLRRKKSEVDKDIAPKEETIINVELTRTQKKFYRAFLQDNASTLLSKITGGAVNSLQNIMMQLRKVCNHPYLIEGAEDAVIEEKMQDPANKEREKFDVELEAMIESSGKLVFVDKLLPKLKDGNHKVLIFSQMVRVLAIIETFLTARGYNYERIDGSVSENDRAAAIQRFNQDPDDFVFLLSTRAGGVGINLTSADTVIIYDSDWNPQNDIQAEARCHRIGQTQKVKVYRLVTANTYETKMFERASQKLGLDHVILDGGDMNKDKPMKAHEIEEMLRYGVANIFKDDDTEADQFTAADIDQILSKRAKVSTQDVISGGDSIFAKVNFNADNNSLDMESEDFWSHVLPSGVNSAEPIMMRRCRKKRVDTEVSTGLTGASSSEISAAIRSIIATGFHGSSPAEAMVLRQAYTVMVPSNDAEKAALEALVAKLPEADEKIVEQIMGEASTQIDLQAEKIVTRAAYFYRLRRALALLQQDTKITWPVISPPWENPVAEYALMVGLDRYGMHAITEIPEDADLDLKKSKPLTRNAIIKRVGNICEALEKLHPDIDKFELKEGEYQLPSAWRESHPEVLCRETLHSTDLLNLVQTIVEIGVPMLKDKSVDWERIREHAKLENVAPSAIESYGQALIEFAIGYEFEEKEKEKDDKDEGLHETRAQAKEREKMREKEKEKEKERERDINYEGYPLLRGLEGKLTLREIRKLQFSIKEMRKVYAFIRKAGHRRNEILKDAPKFSQAPDWWTWEHDRALIQAIAQYGMQLCSIWVCEPTMPFREHIPAELLPSFEECAEKERKKMKPVRPQEKGDFQFIFQERTRIARATNVISFISKEIAKAKQRADREAKKEAEKEGKQKRSRKKEEDDGCLLKPNKNLKIFAYGTLRADKGYSSNTVAFPLGFVSERRFKAPSGENINYRNEVLEGNGKPLFRVTKLVEPPVVFESDNVNTVWQMVVDEFAPVENGEKKPMRVTGSAEFGLTNRDVVEVLLKQPGATLLKCYAKRVKQPETQKFKVVLPLVNLNGTPKTEENEKEEPKTEEKKAEEKEEKETKVEVKEEKKAEEKKPVSPKRGTLDAFVEKQK